MNTEYFFNFFGYLKCRKKIKIVLEVSYKVRTLVMNKGSD